MASWGAGALAANTWATGAWATDAVDTTAPTLSSATVGTNGTTLTLVFSEAVTTGAGGNSGFAMTAPAGSATLTYASGAGTNTLVYTVSRALRSTETGVVLAYSQPGNGIEDSAGNDLATFAGVSVTNNSTQNAAPTGINLSRATITVDAGTNAVIGTLTATDSDWGDTHTFALVAGTGGTNNASFTISGASLICPDPATAGVGTYSVRIRVTDSASNTLDAVFEVAITPPVERINFVEAVTGVDGTADLECQVGDLLVAWVSRDGNVSAPTMPSGWNSVVSGGASSLGFILASKVATSTTESSGTWTNATSIVICQYRPAAGYSLSTGTYASGVNSTGTNALYPALTLQDTSGYSWVQCNYAHRSADIAASNATAAGLTVRAFNQDTTDTQAVHTAGKVTSFAGATVTYTGTSGSRRYIVVEIKTTRISVTLLNIARPIAIPLAINFNEGF